MESDTVYLKIKIKSKNLFCRLSVSRIKQSLNPSFYRVKNMVKRYCITLVSLIIYIYFSFIWCYTRLLTKLEVCVEKYQTEVFTVQKRLRSDIFSYRLSKRD